MILWYFCKDSVLNRITWSDLNEHTKGKCVFYDEKKSFIKNSISKFALKIGKYGFNFGFYLYHWCSPYSDLVIGNKEQFILLVDGSAHNYDPSYIYFLKRHKIKIVFLLLNPYEVTSKYIVDNYMKLSDYIFCYDDLDVQKYGFNRVYNICSQKKYWQDIKNKLIATDSYDYVFVGTINSRMEMINGLNTMLKKHGLKGNVKILIRDGEQYDHSVKNITFIREPLTYEEIIQENLNANCIIEILNSNQHGITRRTMEAIMLNKKLLTNNESLLQLPFYDPRYMQIYKDINEIDYEWVMKREDVKYKYNNEFSPINIINTLCGLNENKI